MANMKKFSNMKDIGHLCAHYERSVPAGHYSNPDIDQSRISEDHINLAPNRGKQTDYIKTKIAEIMDGRTLRKDAVRMCCWVINAPANISSEKKELFFQTAYNFLVDRYGTKSGIGEDVVISAYIHKSESSDHMHFAFMPIVERNGIKSFCAKEAVGRDDLRTFHEQLSEVMEKKGICKRSDILNGATKRDSAGRALSIKELKRQRNVERTRDRTLNRWNNASTEIKIERTIDRW